MLAVLASSAGGAAWAADFAGAGIGSIPDGVPAGMNVTFNVSGIAQPLQRVQVRLGLTHTWVGDLKATLTSPGGKAQLLLVGRLGLLRGGVFGSSNNFGGVYGFADAGGDLWAALNPGAGTSYVIPPGIYRAGTEGTASSNHGGCTTSLTLAFGGLAGGDVNGTWTLNISDNASGDTGSVDSAVLTLLDDVIFDDGFDPLLGGSCKLAWGDMTGTGRTSYTTVRNTGGGSNGAVTWFVQGNGSGGIGSSQSFVFGTAVDFFTVGDFDGDGIADAVTWTAGAAGVARYSVRRSSRPGDAPLVVVMGQTGDDPLQIGDYDGDRLDDFALYRKGATSADASHTLIRLNRSGVLRDWVTGMGSSFAMAGVDYTGDGRADIAIQSSAGASAQFDIYDGSNGALVKVFNFGTPTNVVVIGNHVGNALYDITTEAGVGGNIQWTSYDMGTSAAQPAVVWGVSASDYPLSGDYDGDGLDDYAVWRPSATPGQSKFMVRGSTTTVPDMAWGQNGDYPVANARAH